MNKGYTENRFSKPLLFFFLLVLPSVVFSQVRRQFTYEDYVSIYKNMAIDHMDKYKIPASITLAQGLLESGAGKSSLAQNANNHFGIKCHNDWNGKRFYQDDDFKNDCFRRYNKAEESYRDHSNFLTGRQRYNSLFTLDITDYRGWAKGLQKAGYATDKTYANKLIKLIEEYQLYQYDREKRNVAEKNKGKNNAAINNDPIIIIDRNTEPNPVKRPLPQPSPQPAPVPQAVQNRHIPYKTHGLVYIVAENGDSYYAIAKEFNFRVNELSSYNEVSANASLQKGDLVYFERKKLKADKPYYEHVVKMGESMHGISQLYGITSANLYRMNKKGKSYKPGEGDVLRLR